MLSRGAEIDYCNPENTWPELAIAIYVKELKQSSPIKQI
jgi:hypothetical protein